MSRVTVRIASIAAVLMGLWAGLADVDQWSVRVTVCTSAAPATSVAA